MRRAARVDDNQAALVKLWRELGSSYLHLYQLGSGVPDGLVGVPGLTIVCYQPLDANLMGFVLDRMGIDKFAIHTGANLLAEVKDGSKKPSAQRLTPAEVEFHNTWRGQVCVVNSIEAARKLVGK